MSDAPRIGSDSTNYLPGQILAGRYRMFGVLGRGGMGEVYRADDLKLGQPVALKFLATNLEDDAERREAFLSEVRLSLRVTHPNVCRVYDIGEVDGRHFLSMEYVDGEDLASLLRRIGRLPEDKATEIARQICAGLAAAHDEKILHRDLKPANIMIDGRGRAKITDFGLAGATAGISGRDAQAGTPAYMSPEQFDGAELTVRSDLYSLGLVLYELFTGKQAFEARNILEHAAMRSNTPTTPAAHVSGLNPIIERAILRCLDPDPAKRPESAEKLAAILPGGDPLAMALAAGETPSPDVVAQAGGSGELRPWIAAALLAIVLVGLGLIWYKAGGPDRIHNRIPIPKSADELRYTAQSILSAAGYPDRTGAHAGGFAYSEGYFRHIEGSDTSKSRWDSVATVYPVPLSYWYRESPQALRLPFNTGTISFVDPPYIEPGMLRLRLDPSGRLQELGAVPQQLAETPGPWAEPDWSPLFTAAGLNLSEWSVAEPEWPPQRGSDLRRAWTKDKLRIEATSFQGRATWFRVVPEWERPAAVERTKATFGSRLQGSEGDLIFAAIIAVAIIVARRNHRRGRADWRGATRLALAYICVAAALEFVRLENRPAQIFSVFMQGFLLNFAVGAAICVIYLAVEPFVRRWWPDCLIAWSRVVDGRLRDPLVGRHILLGATVGVSLSVLQLLLPSLNRPVMTDIGVGAIGTVPSWTSDGAFAALILSTMIGSIFTALLMLVLGLILRALLRREWLVYAGLVLIAMVLTIATGSNWTTTFAGPVALGTLFFVVTRLGLVAMIALVLFRNIQALALTTNQEAWFFHHSVVTFLLFGGLAVYGFFTAIGGQKVFREDI